MTRTRHVWVTPLHMRSLHPGIVLSWRQDESGWEALVTYVEDSGRVVTEWLPAAQLKPAPTEPYRGTAYG